MNPDMQNERHQQQENICKKYGAGIETCPAGLKVGISRNIRDGILPINGVRIKPEGGLSGWFIWAGEWSDDPEFFVPLHVGHLDDWCPSAIPYLLLPPGWRFQVAPNHEDVWFDPNVRP